MGDEEEVVGNSIPVVAKDNPTPIATATPVQEPPQKKTVIISSLKVKDLKDHLRAHGLQVGGDKAKLIT